LVKHLDPGIDKEEHGWLSHMVVFCVLTWKWSLFLTNGESDDLPLTHGRVSQVFCLFLWFYSCSNSWIKLIIHTWITFVFNIGSVVEALD